MKTLTIIVVSALGLTLFTLSFSSSRAADWKQIEFPRCIFHDPNYYLQIEHPALLPPDSSHYDSIDALGINLISTVIGSGEWRHEVLKPSVNRYMIPALISTSLYDYTNLCRKPALGSLSQAVAFKKPAAQWRDRIALNRHARRGFENGRYVIKVNPAAYGPGEFASSVNDTFRVCLVNPGESRWRKGEIRSCFIQVQAKTLNEYSGSQPILEIELWEEGGGGWKRNYYFTGKPTPHQKPDYTYFQLTDEWKWFTLIDFDDIQKMRGNASIQIKFKSITDMDIEIRIDSIAVYDSLGYAAAYNHWHGKKNTVEYIQHALDVKDALDAVYDLDTYDLIIDFILDEPPEQSLLNTIVMDSIAFAHRRNHRIHTTRPWGHKEWGKYAHQVSWTNYAQAMLDSMDNYAPLPEYLFSMIYPYREDCASGSSKTAVREVQSALDDFIGYTDTDVIFPALGSESRNLLYNYYVYQAARNPRSGGAKPFTIIQCQEDWYTARGKWRTHHRNPVNAAEILVQGYLTLAYGHKGLGYYIFWTDVYRDHPQTYISGIYQWDRFSSVWRPVCCGSTSGGTSPPLKGTPKTEAIRELNFDIDILAPTLLNLELMNGPAENIRGGCFQYNHTPPPPNSPPANLRIVKNITASGGDGYIEIVEFITVEEGKIPPGDYFMLVNRDVNHGQLIRITLARPDTEGYFLEDMSSHRVYRADSKAGGSFAAEVFIPAGRGILFRVSDDYTWRGQARVKGDVQIPPGMILNIAAGCTVKVYNDADSSGAKTGGLIVNPSAGAGLRIEGAPENMVVFTPGYHTKSGQRRADPWVGIRFIGEPGLPRTLPESKIEYCLIENSEVGIKIEGEELLKSLKTTGVKVTD